MLEDSSSEPTTTTDPIPTELWSITIGQGRDYADIMFAPRPFPLVFF